MARPDVLRQVASYYSGKLDAHGVTPKGVDWRDVSSQQIRFAQFDSLFNGDWSGSIADLGCGYGEYLTYLRQRGFTGAYYGIDVAAAMIEAAQQRFRNDTHARFAVDHAVHEPHDYIVASGIFNVRLDVPVDAWESYVASTIETMAKCACRGIAFNCITNKVDYMRDDLYYGDPQLWRLHCEKFLGGEAELHENYGLYDFTIVVRKNAPVHR